MDTACRGQGWVFYHPHPTGPKVQPTQAPNVPQGNLKTVGNAPTD